MSKVDICLAPPNGHEIHSTEDSGDEDFGGMLFITWMVYFSGHSWRLNTLCNVSTLFIFFQKKWNINQCHCCLKRHSEGPGTPKNTTKYGPSIFLCRTAQQSFILTSISACSKLKTFVVFWYILKLCQQQTRTFLYTNYVLL